MKFQNKCIIITGGANGIGKSVAQAFHAEGAKVAIADIDGERAIAVGQACGGFGAKIDVTNETELSDFIAEVDDRLGPIDYYFSNAGIARPNGKGDMPAGTSNEHWDLSWRVNVMSSIYGARYVIPQMIENGGGTFIIMASAAGLLNQVGSAVYSVTKHAAVPLAESLFIAHKGSGVDVYCVCPQGVRTDFIKGAEKSLELAGEILEPEQVAQMIVDAMGQEKFFIETSPALREHAQMRTGDPDQWLGHMRKIRSTLGASQ